MSSTVLGEKDANATIEQQHQLSEGKEVKSMDYHRQVFQSKLEQEPTKQYVSPSDNIMSPCTAKINALRNKHVSKAKPRSLFAQASDRKLNGENLLGARSVTKP